MVIRAIVQSPTQVCARNLYHETSKIHIFSFEFHNFRLAVDHSHRQNRRYEIINHPWNLAFFRQCKSRRIQHANASLIESGAFKKRVKPTGNFQLEEQKLHFSSIYEDRIFHFSSDPRQFARARLFFSNFITQLYYIIEQKYQLKLFSSRTEMRNKQDKREEKINYDFAIKTQSHLNICFSSHLELRISIIVYIRGSIFACFIYAWTLPTAYEQDEIVSWRRFVSRRCFMVRRNIIPVWCNPSVFPRAPLSFARVHSSLPLSRSGADARRTWS